MIKNEVIKPYKLKRERLPLNYDSIDKRDLFVEFTYEFPSTYLCELKNAFVSPFGVVFENLRLVKESLYSDDHAKNQYRSFFKKLMLRKIIHIKGLSVISIHAWFDNYYHFLTDVIPRLYLVRDKADYVKVLLRDSPPKFVLQYLQILGFKHIEFIKINELAKVEDLLLPMYTSAGLRNNETLMREIRDWIKGKVEDSLIDINTVSRSNVYITRKKAKYRKIINEDEVLIVLKKFNFQVLELEDFCIKEQISIFHTAKNVVAIHGAGIANIMYMKPGGLLIDLIHGNHQDSAFYNLAHAFDIDTVILQGIPKEGSSYCTIDDFYIDVPKLEKYLQHYLK